MDATTVDAVQPEQGQGGAPGAAPYGQYLDRIPEDLRSQVEPVFRDWDAQVTRRFQELSSASKRWEPFEQAGLHEHDPQTLTGLVEFARMTDDNEQFTEWLRGQAEQAGLLTPQTDDTYLDPSVEALVQQRVAPLQQQVEQFRAWQEQQELAQAQRTAADAIRARLSELRAEHGEFPEDAVEKLVPNYANTDPHNAVDRAFADYQKLRADIEQAVFAGKLDQPGTPELSGAPDSQPQPITTLKQAEAVALERLKQANRS